MNGAEKVPNFKLTRYWIIALGIFLLVQVIFFLIDGTSLEPRINDSDSFLPRILRSILDLRLFTEWITPYSYPYFNLAITVHILALLIAAIRDVIAILISKK
ncbi:YfzA-like protein [Terribacillus halophilus]|uniref:YfzA-like protein n=1 Tax=Terribacillus halophilus TaxID=361279 RepID=A0A1G6UMI6_9BACI|nr:YfzA family protein [Terribacillus halophilus]SDD41926.1 YfzA-like protein [Terribacillus halophilus]